MTLRAIHRDVDLREIYFIIVLDTSVWQTGAYLMLRFPSFHTSQLAALIVFHSVVPGSGQDVAFID